MSFAIRANHTSMKTSKQAAKKIESRNQGWGFYAALRENLHLADGQAADAFDRAARFTAYRLELSTAAARRFLDSRLGRHLADGCGALGEIESRLGALYDLWKRDVREFRQMAINTSDEAFYA